MFLTPAIAHSIRAFMARFFLNGSALKTSSSTTMSMAGFLLGGNVAPFSSQQLGWVNGESPSGRVVCDLKWRESAALEPCFLSQRIHWKCLWMAAFKERKTAPCSRAMERVMWVGLDWVGAIAKTEIDDEG